MGSRHVAHSIAIAAARTPRPSGLGATSSATSTVGTYCWSVSAPAALTVASPAVYSAAHFRMAVRVAMGVTAAALGVIGVIFENMVMALGGGAPGIDVLAIGAMPQEHRDRTHNDAEIVDYHRTMLVDDARMHAFTRAIMAAVHPGDVVCDIGAGTGVLSFLAATAGAARIYAIEQGPVVELAQALGERNGFADRVTFLAGHSTEIELPEPVDVVITETIGNAAFDEGILRWVEDARTRLLRPGGRVVPKRLRLWTAAVESWDDYAYVSDWAAPSLPFDFNVVRETAERLLWWVDLTERNVLSEPGLVADIDLSAAGDADVSGRGTLIARRDGVLHGLACWFDSEVGKEIWVGNAPPTEAPSWSQALLPAPAPIDVSAGQRLEWEIRASADGEAWQWHVVPGAVAASGA